MNLRLDEILKKPKKENLLYFLQTSNRKEILSLYAFANRIRKEKRGDLLRLRAIVEFSNYCKNNCLYCGIRVENRGLPRYRMDEAQVIEAVSRAKELGFRIFVLQSGEDPFYTTEKIVRLIKTLVNELGVEITLAIGERSFEDYLQFYKAGAKRYLLKHETVDRKNYALLHPCQSLKERIRCLKELNQIGFKTGSGIIIGLSGQTPETIAKDLLLFRRLRIDMIGSGPFIPHPQTPLKDLSAGSVELTIRVIALSRIVRPPANIPATTALSNLSPIDGMVQALSSGANVIMLNATPVEYRQLYEIYPNKKRIDTMLENELESVKKIANRLKFKIVFDR